MDLEKEKWSDGEEEGCYSTLAAQASSICRMRFAQVMGAVCSKNFLSHG